MLKVNSDYKKIRKKIETIKDTKNKQHISR